MFELQITNLLIIYVYKTHAILYVGENCFRKFHNLF